ncbi:MAG: SDR family oxidoreductase [Myxococcota bacterium]
MSVKNKVVVVTGASSGIGASTVEQLSKQGARVVAAARRKEPLERLTAGLPSEALAVVTDVSKRSDVDALIEATVERFGRVDVLVNNAGIMPVSPLSLGQVDDWDRMIDVNVKGVLYGINSVLPRMLEHGGGHIVSTSSVAGLAVERGGAVYSATKFAVRAICEGLRKENPGKIRVTTVYPGLVDTELTNSVTHPAVKELVDKMYDGKSIAPSAIASAICYAIAQPDEVAVNEIVVRPTAQEF